MKWVSHPEWLYNGARVILTRDHPDGNSDLVRGCRGTFRGKYDLSDRPGIEWDDVIEDGHNCDGSVSSRHGWYVGIEDLASADNFDDENNEEELPEYSASDIMEFILA